MSAVRLRPNYFERGKTQKKRFVRSLCRYCTPSYGLMAPAISVASTSMYKVKDFESFKPT